MGAKELGKSANQEKATRDQERKAAQVARKEALAKLVEYGLKSTDPTVLTIAKLLVEKTKARITFGERLVNLFEGKDSVHEDQVWKKAHIGRQEMKELIKRAIMSKSGIWVSFDPTTGNYAIVSRKPETPEGWTGWLPSKK